MKVKKESFETITLSFDEVKKLLIEQLKLDDKYSLTITHQDNLIWDYKLDFKFTKVTEIK